jgi:hypothetical protein
MGVSIEGACEDMFFTRQRFLLLPAGKSRNPFTLPPTNTIPVNDDSTYPPADEVVPMNPLLTFLLLGAGCSTTLDLLKSPLWLIILHSRDQYLSSASWPPVDPNITLYQHLLFKLELCDHLHFYGDERALHGWIHKLVMGLIIDKCPSSDTKTFFRPPLLVWDILEIECLGDN